MRPHQQAGSASAAPAAPAAVVQRRHRVEKMRHAPHAVAERGAHLLERPVGVSRRKDDARAREVAQRRGAGHLRRERDEGPSVAQRRQQLHVARAQFAELRRVVRARARGVDERPFDVDARDAGHARLDRLAHRFDGARDRAEVLADEGRQEGRGAEAPMRRADGPDRGHVRIVVEERAAAAIHLAVDEAGHEPRARQVDAPRLAHASVGGGHDSGDARAVEEHGAIGGEAFVEQHACRGEGEHQRVCVTLRRWGGLSGS
jgi:hypothetical protein